MIILLGKHDHVKAIIGIYNIIYDSSCGKFTISYILVAIHPPYLALGRSHIQLALDYD